MAILAARAQQMGNVGPAGGEQLCDQPAVAPLPGRLGAHEAGGRLGQLRGEGGLPGVAAHARGVASERGRPDAPELLLAGLAAAAAAKFDGVPVDGAGGSRGRR